MRIKDMMRMAAEFTIAGNPRRGYWLGAIGQTRDGLIVISRNEIEKFVCPGKHAEAKLAKKIGMYADLVIVVRVRRKDRSFAMSKPCASCELALAKKKVKKVLFTDVDGKLTHLW